MSNGTSLILGAAAVAGFLIAAAGGFSMGYRFAQSAPSRLLRRAGRDSDRCLSQATTAIDMAGTLCEAVAAATVATERQMAALFERQQRLSEAIGRLHSSFRSAAAPESREIQWQSEPVDRETDLPDRTAFDENVSRLVAAASDSVRGGILLVSLDGIERLRDRIGESRLAAVRHSVARVLCRAGRDSDLTCRFDANTFAILLPDMDDRAALAQVSDVRDAFRSHPFQLGADGPELLVTASFGFTPAVPGDEARLALDRAQAGVVRSRRWGRNRLHGYEPQTGRFVLIAENTHESPVAVGASVSS